MFADRLAAAVILVLAVAGCAAPPPPTDALKGPTMNVADRLARCTPRTATLTLIEEALLTRTRVTAASVASHAMPVTFGVGDQRLDGLATILASVAPAASTLSEFDPRTLISMTCADGSTLALIGSATEDDGTMYLRIGDELAVTRAPLRRQLDALIAGG